MNDTEILVVDDEEMVARVVERALRAGGYSVAVANSGIEALQHARRYPPDMMILDVLMPGMDGYEVCRQVRNDPFLKNLPVLFLTAKGRDEETITGFRAGGDDYLKKPFNLDELYLRVKAILRRSERETDIDEPKHELTIRDYTLNRRTFQVTGPRGTVSLTPVQFDLLYHLMSHVGEVFSSEKLLQEVWDYPHDTGSEDLVRVHMKNLRSKIEINPKEPTFITTLKGYGYVVSP